MLSLHSLLQRRFVIIRGVPGQSDTLVCVFFGVPSISPVRLGPTLRFCNSPPVRVTNPSTTSGGKKSKPSTK